MREYCKIPGPFKREVEGPNRNKFIEGEWATTELEVLRDVLWTWTEKVDGTNIRIGWDGHRVTFGGRTDNAQLPTKLLQYLVKTFPEELLEQSFGGTPATLYGEGYGAGIQKGGGNYRPDQSFILFDVLVDDRWWLRRLDVLDVAAKLGIDFVPQVGTFTLREAISLMKNGFFVSLWENVPHPEGVVGVPECGLLTRGGERIIVKVKWKDFH